MHVCFISICIVHIHFELHLKLTSVVDLDFVDLGLGLDLNWVDWVGLSYYGDYNNLYNIS